MFISLRTSLATGVKRELHKVTRDPTFNCALVKQFGMPGRTDERKMTRYAVLKRAL